MESVLARAGLWLAILFVAILGIAAAADTAFAVHMGIVAIAACIWMAGHLARMELKVALQEWLKRIPKFSVKPGERIEFKLGGVIGPKALPLVWQAPVC